MRVHGAAAFGFVAFSLAAFPVAAQEARTVEVTPYVGLGTSGASPVGTAVTFPLTSRFGLETDMAYRRGEGNINALSSSVSLLFYPPRIGKTSSYVAGGVGFAQYGSPVFSSAGGAPIGVQSRLAFTVNAGGGIQTPLTNRMDLRTDARWTKSFGNEGSEQFRVAQGLAFGLGKR